MTTNIVEVYLVNLIQEIKDKVFAEDDNLMQLVPYLECEIGMDKSYIKKLDQEYNLGIGL